MGLPGSGLWGSFAPTGPGGFFGMGLGSDPAGADKMFVIIPIAQVADHDAGDGGMDKFIIPQIDADMGDRPVSSQRVKKDQVSFLQFTATDMMGGFILFS